MIKTTNHYSTRYHVSRTELTADEGDLNRALNVFRRLQSATGARERVDVHPTFVVTAVEVTGLDVASIYHERRASLYVSTTGAHRPFVLISLATRRPDVEA